MTTGLVNYVLIAALRDKLVMLVLLGAVLSLCLSLFFGGAAIVEQRQFSIVFAASALRLFGVCGLVLFCVTFIRRAFEHKDIEFLLARPVSRKALVFSFSTGFSFLALILALFFSAIVYVNVYASTEMPAVALWALSLCMEYIIVINAAFFFSMVITTTTGATMAVFGFYILSRMSGQFLGIIDSKKTVITEGSDVLEFVIQVVTAIMPRLDLMAQSSWLVYGHDGSISMMAVLAQGIVYSCLLVGAALLDLLRKQF